MEPSEIIYDHYKETDELRRNAQGKRDKSFVCVCILEAFSFFLINKTRRSVDHILGWYQSKLEKELSQEIKKVISREGDNYTENYPMVSNFIDLFYKMFCPILFLVINSVHIYKEWVQTPKVNFRLVCDTVLYTDCF